MIGMISRRKEESGFGEGRGEAAGTQRGARIKLIQCWMYGMRVGFSGADLLQLVRQRRPFNQQGKYSRANIIVCLEQNI